MNVRIHRFICICWQLYSIHFTKYYIFIHADYFYTVFISISSEIPLLNDVYITFFSSWEVIYMVAEQH